MGNNKHSLNQILRFLCPKVGAGRNVLQYLEQLHIQDVSFGWYLLVHSPVAIQVETKHISDSMYILVWPATTVPHMRRGARKGRGVCGIAGQTMYVDKTLQSKPSIGDLLRMLKMSTTIVYINND